MASKLIEKLKNIFFDEVDDERPTDGLQFFNDDNRQFNQFDIAGAPDIDDYYPDNPNQPDQAVYQQQPYQEPIQQPVYQQPSYQQSPYQQPTEEPVKKKDSYLSPVISPIYGVMIDPSPVFQQENQTNSRIVQPMEGEYNPVVSPMYGHFQPETATGNFQAPPNNPQPAQNYKAMVEPAPTVNEPVWPKQPEYQATAPAEVQQPVQNVAVNSQDNAVWPSPQPTDDELFKDTTGPYWAGTQMPDEPTLFSGSNEIIEVQEKPKQLRRRKQGSAPAPEVMDSLFDDFTANFTTQQLEKLADEQGGGELNFNKFDLFNGE